MDIKEDFLAWCDGETAKVNQVERMNLQLQAVIDTQIVTIKDQADIIAKLTPIKQKYYGIVGHLFDSPIYKDITSFIQTAKLLDFNATRMSIPLNADGAIINETDFFSRIYIPLKLAGIEPFMLLNTKGLNPNAVDLVAQYNIAYTLTNGFITKYGRIFPTLELGNELALKALLPGKDGRKVNDYDPAKLTAIGNYLKGAYEGAKAANPDVKIMLNGEWIHWGFTDAMKGYIKFDILSWHWYVGSPNQDVLLASYAWAEGKPIEDILSERYPDVEIIFNEVGYASPKLPFDQDKQVAQLPPLIKRLRDKGYSVFIYQLLDQPEKSILEANYGLFDKDYKPKKIVNELISI